MYRCSLVVPDLLWLELQLVGGISCTHHTANLTFLPSVFEYTYLLFWNSFWTIAPVIGIGLFDRFADDHVLMAVPELYYFGREGRWFGITQFIVYMFDGLMQSAIIYFLIMFPYNTTSARPDGWDVGLYEFSTVCFHLPT